MSSKFEIIKRLNEIGISLSSEKDTDKLIETILLSVKEITNADAGSIYSVIDNNALKFEVIVNDTLDIYMGGSSAVEISFPNLKIFKDDGTKITNMVVARSFHDKAPINIKDVYESSEFDTSGTLKFDQQTGYRTQSTMTIPMINHENDIIGVLQLINRLDNNGEVIAFSEEDLEISQSLASQAAVAITNKSLIKDLKNLFEAFIKTIATAIDDKSPYTGTHCKHVPLLTSLIADEASKITTGPLTSFTMNEEDRYELNIAGWLHDCGKVTTPEYVMDKATKLQTIFDRIELIDNRFEIKIKEIENNILKQKLKLVAKVSTDDTTEDIENTIKSLEKEVINIKQYRKEIDKFNIGGEFMRDDDLQHLETIAKIKWTNSDGQERPIITNDELYNLSIRKGTLTTEERTVIQNHMVSTVKMLDSLPFPKHLKNVPEYAGGHHETMDGKGYPKGLKRDDMSVQARIMAVADIFEALTAIDRPYKKGKKLSECLFIMGKMKENNHIDPDIFDLFVDNKIYLKYAKEHMQANQIDDIDITKIPAYTPREHLNN